jgi:drug/metabolite transporter (DMT)-like permease
VVLWGFTAILGKLITLAALPLVWWRMVIVTVALIALPRVWRGVRALPRRLLGAYVGVGTLVALHWLTFYGAIKLANASVAVTCIALATVFIAIIEPPLTGARFSRVDLSLGVVVLPGVALVVGGVPGDMRLGVLVGVLSALFVAVSGTLNKRLVAHADPLTVTALELGAGAAALTVLAPFMPWLFPEFAGALLEWPSSRDLALLLVLAFACTLFPFALSLVALRHISAFGAQLAINLEPVYAIFLAIVFLGEQRELTALFYSGVAIILITVLAHPLLSRPRRVQHVEQLGTAEAKHIAD